MIKRSNILTFEKPKKPNEQQIEGVLSRIFCKQAEEDIYMIVDLAMADFSADSPVSVREFATALLAYKGSMAQLATKAQTLDMDMVFAYAAIGQKSQMQNMLDINLAHAKKKSITKNDAGYNIARAFSVAADTRDVARYCAEIWVKNPENAAEMLIAMPALAVGDRNSLDVRQPQRLYEDMGLDIDAESLGSLLRAKAEKMIGMRLPDLVAEKIPSMMSKSSGDATNILKFKKRGNT